MNLKNVCFWLLGAVTFTANSQPVIHITEPNDTLCAPGTMQLHGTTTQHAQFFYYKWRPANRVSVSTVNNRPNTNTNPVTVATVNETTTFYLDGYYESFNNLVVNGNFSAGNTGFSSEYGYATGYNSLYPEGLYSIVTRSYDVHIGFSMAYDHTSGNASGKYMAVNGAIVAGKTVWEEIITVTPNTDYIFYTWVMSLANGNVAQLQFRINNTLIGNIFYSPAQTSVWAQFYTTWNSGNNTQATITIVNQNTEGSGNDFGLDDIYFAPIVPVTDSVTIYLGHPIDTAIYDTLCLGETFDYGSIHITPAAIGQLDSTVTVQNGLGCDSTIHVHLTVGASTTITPIVDNNPCENNQSSITLILSGGAAPYSCLWAHGATDSVLTQLAYGDYSVIVTDVQGCIAFDTITLIANDFAAYIDTVMPSYCKNNDGQAIITSTGGSGAYELLSANFSYVPSGNDFIAQNLKAGYYQADVTDGICTTHVAFSVANLGDPNACFRAIYDSHNFEVETNFVSCSDKVTDYLWDFGDGGSSIDMSPSHTYSDFGQYQVMLAVSDDYGCTDTVSQLLTFLDLAYCYIPNAFTPNNNDNLNETFRPICSNIQPEDYLFEIYDRWGNKVFESHDIQQGWNGQINGKYPSTATLFVWSFHYRNERHKLQHKTGQVILMR